METRVPKDGKKNWRHIQNKLKMPLLFFCAIASARRQKDEVQVQQEPKSHNPYCRKMGRLSSGVMSSLKDDGGWGFFLVLSLLQIFRKKKEGRKRYKKKWSGGKYSRPATKTSSPNITVPRCLGSRPDRIGRGVLGWGTAVALSLFRSTSLIREPLPGPEQ